MERRHWAQSQRETPELVSPLAQKYQSMSASTTWANPLLCVSWVYQGKWPWGCLYFQLKLWLEESFKYLSFSETLAQRIIIYIVWTIFIKYAMELGNPNLDEVQELPSWKRKGNYRKAFQRKVVETLANFSLRPSQGLVTQRGSWSG